MSNRMIRHKQSPGAPLPVPTSPWLVGAAIGMAIMTMAGSAMALGAGLALSEAPVKGK